ncbi:MAG: hypothetical protein JWM71_1424, partial [Solirubrobacteraceae bacterium]|nr:hypothetical protein [Solirubrobacteraceae bacterium]
TLFRSRAGVGRNVGAMRAARVVSAPGGATRATRFSDGSQASLVVFVIGGEGRLAWDLAYPGRDAALYHAVVDASTGRMLFRANATKSVSASSIYPYYPGAAGAAGNGGAGPVTFPSTWIGASPTRLSGTNAHVYSDVNDNNVADSGEDVAPSSPGQFDYPLTRVSSNCPHASIFCSWDPANPGGTSWTVNRQQNATQVFWFVNTFHDHLAAPPINFTAAAGAFEGTDPLNAETDDGANGPGGNPDDDHTDNANMSTPPDGSRPRMQMYLFERGSGFNNINGGDDAAIVYHEYTHGLSSRLVTTSDGWEALDSAQAGAMGEAWSDWYAMDYLVAQGAQADTGAPGELDLGAYTDASPDQLRTQPMDCPVGTTSSLCPGLAGRPGGYTYGDLGQIIGGPEVHADGEIWGETLWDLRTALDPAKAEELITDAMRLSPPQPSFLDMRNAILAADTADFSGNDRATIWAVFDARGMGFFASTTDSDDTAPIEDFSPPPADGGPTGAIAGRILDSTSGLPLEGVDVGLGGHTTPTSADDAFATTTSSSGDFALGNLPVGSYPQLVASAAGGYDTNVAGALAVTAGATTAANMLLDRDWAAADGGSAVTDATGRSDTADGCGPQAATDQSLATGWSAANPTYVDPDLGQAATPSATISLPQAITLTALGIDPSATCGDGASASLGNYTVETSADGIAWAPATSGTMTPADRGQVNRVAMDPPIGGVRFLRLTMLSPQGPTGPTYSGQTNIDLTEITAYGAPPNVLPSGALVLPASATPGQAVTLNASSFSDPDSAITGYDWDFDGDGTVDATTVGPATTHVYSAAGTFTPRVLVDDFRGGAGAASATIAVRAAGPAVPPATPKRPQVALLKQTKRGAVRLQVTCSSACTARVQLTASRSLAKLLRLKSRRVASRVKHLSKGRSTFTVSLTAKALARWRHVRLKQSKIAVLVTVLDHAGLKTTRRASVTVRRP